MTVDLAPTTALHAPDADPARRLLGIYSNTVASNAHRSWVEGLAHNPDGSRPKYFLIPARSTADADMEPEEVRWFKRELVSDTDGSKEKPLPDGWVEISDETGAHRQDIAAVPFSALQPELRKLFRSQALDALATTHQYISELVGQGDLHLVAQAIAKKQISQDDIEALLRFAAERRDAGTGGLLHDEPSYLRSLVQASLDPVAVEIAPGRSVFRGAVIGYDVGRLIVFLLRRSRIGRWLGQGVADLGAEYATDVLPKRPKFLYPPVLERDV